jgi:transposase, IS30 family
MDRWQTGGFGGSGYPLPVAARVEIARRLARGERQCDVAAALGVSQRTISRLIKSDGMPGPRRKDRSPRHLSIGEREEISRGLSRGESFRQIAAVLARSPGTVSREVGLNGGRQRYRAWKADERAAQLAARPKPTLFEQHPGLAAYVEAKLQLKWSPQEIAGRLPIEYPDDPEMRVSPETIYQTLFVQGRGGLRKELTRQLRSGRTRRRPHGRTATTGKLRDMVMISERPAEADDRAVPGHWEGDLIIGTPGTSAAATLVERTSGLVLLGGLPSGHTAPQTRAAITAKITSLPERLRASLTWDQGKEMAQHAQFTIDTGVQVYFCDPHSPWQRPSNENTNGLLRQYFPKGADLSTVTQDQLDAVADELNSRPRRRHGYLTPSEIYNQLVATTA